MNVLAENAARRELSRGLVAAVLLLGLLFALRAAVNPRMVDDTLITFQYARVLIEHGLLTWHQDLPMVDGYTSLGHVLLLAAGMALGLDVVLTNTLVSLVSMAAIVALFLRAASARGAPAWAMAVGLLVILGNSGFVFWVSAGLESVLYAAVFLTVCLRYERALDRGRLTMGDAAAMLALGLVRPEGCFIALALVAFHVLHGLARGAPLRGSLPAIAATVGSILAIFAWRAWVYGYPLPNTYYAKTSASRMDEIADGLRYLENWILYFGGAAVVATLAHTLANPRNYVRTLFILGQIAVVALSGGDPHPEMRFMLPIIPLIALELTALFSRPSVVQRLVAGVLLLLYLAAQFPPPTAIRWSLFENRHHGVTVPYLHFGLANIVTGDWPFTSFARNPKLAQGLNAAAGARIGEVLAPDARIASADVGALAYFSGRPVLDAFGLNHQRIAHLDKPEGEGNLYGILRFDVTIDEGAEVIYPAYPRYDDWTWRGLVAGADSCAPVARKLRRSTEKVVDKVVEGYLCATVAAENGAGYLNLLVRRDALARVFTPAAGAPDISDCYAAFQSVCEAE